MSMPTNCGTGEGMKIGLIDVDGHNGFPNLALMHLSAWHKAQGDSVEWCFPFDRYDRVYTSKVFTFTPDYPYAINADEVVRGGTGYGDYTVVLPDEVEQTFPDYSLYPDCDHAIGFLTRGCIRSCPWCVVPKKEGQIRKNLSWREIKRSDSDKIVFLDNNVLAHPWGLEQIKSLGGTGVAVDFNQGMDARLVTDEIAKDLAKLRWIRFVRFSCDTSAMIPVVREARDRLLAAGVAKSRLFCYALLQDLEEGHDRIVALSDLGFEVFAQPYINFDDGTVDPRLKRMARWCNHKAIFKKVRWEQYKKEGIWTT